MLSDLQLRNIEENEKQNACNILKNDQERLDSLFHDMIFSFFSFLYVLAIFFNFDVLNLHFIFLSSLSFASLRILLCDTFFHSKLKKTSAFICVLIIALVSYHFENFLFLSLVTNFVILVLGITICSIDYVATKLSEKEQLHILNTY